MCRFNKNKGFFCTISISLFLILFLLSVFLLKGTGKKNSKEFCTNSGISIDSYNARAVEDLALLCKIWGFLKYYHPAIAKGKYNWDFELFRIMPPVLDARSSQERNHILSEWIKNTGEVETKEYTIKDSLSVKIYPNIDWITDQVALGDASQLLTKIKEANRMDRENWDYIEFSHDKKPIIKNEETYAALSCPDVGYRLLALFRYWNIIEYYYPHKYLTDKNWDEVLTDFIPQFIEAKSALDYRLVVLKLIAQINDSHAGLLSDEILEEYKGLNSIPAEINFVEEKAVVTNIYKVNGKEIFTSLSKGDIILSVNHNSVDTLVHKMLPYTSASNYPTQLRNIATDLLRTNEKKLYITYERNGMCFSDTILCYPFNSINSWSSYQQDKPVVQQLPGNITYLYLGSSIGGNILDKITGKGIIIDLRCYPNEEKINGYWDFLQLYPDSIVFAKFTTVNVFCPGLFLFTDTTGVGQKNDQYYKGIRDGRDEVLEKAMELIGK